MKSKKVFMFIFRLFSGIAIALLIRYALVTITFGFAIGQDPRFDMGDNYEMWGPQFSVYYWRSKDKNHMPQGIIPERVVEFALKVRGCLEGRRKAGGLPLTKRLTTYTTHARQKPNYKALQVLIYHL